MLLFFGALALLLFLLLLLAPLPLGSSVGGVCWVAVALFALFLILLLFTSRAVGAFVLVFIFWTGNSVTLAAHVSGIEGTDGRAVGCWFTGGRGDGCVSAGGCCGGGMLGC